MHSVRVLPAARRDLDALDAGAFSRIKSKILILRESPRPLGVVKLTAEEGYRLRVGDFRILYRVEDGSKTVFIYRVKHRREVYR